MKIIKRYKNRKLYDTVQSRYVTLKDIAWDSRNDVAFLVVDNVSKRDITVKTLLQAFSENANVTLNDMHDLIETYTGDQK
jgi:polyhydroxyalkanoate synthesis regulator protein